MRALLLAGCLLLPLQEKLETPELKTGFGGTWVEALRAIERLSDEGEPVRAARIADDLVADAGRVLSEPRCAELRYAAGVAWARAERPLDARGAFHSARALAGPGELRRDATYNLGVLRLERAEELRARLLEPEAQAPAVPNAEEEQDPIAVARAVYRKARELFVERLRDDWRDEDTRANLELIQRRLRELDELEQREQEQQEDQQDGDQQQEGDQSGDPGEEEQDEEQEQEEEQEDPEDSNDQQQSDAEPEAGESAPPQQLGQQELPEGEEQFSEEAAERHLTREEVMRLLDKLADIDEEGELLRQLLKKGERIPVEKDW